MCNTFEARFKILEKIGEGSFSEVLKCEHRASRVCYAAKRLKKTYRTENGFANCPEIIASQKVSYHPNLLNLLEYHYDSFYGKAIFIFELMDMSMYDYLRTKRKGLSEVRVRNYLYQMLNGLGHLHAHGLFHRDIKPENILIKFPSILYSPLSQSIPNEIVKLGDLGSIRGIFSEPPYTEYISTRWYRSPECLLTMGHYGAKMDVWATGCVFYEMLTLKPLFPGCNEIDQLHKIHQVLGSPSLQYLQRLKNQSQNFVSFPKTHGCGLDVLIPFISRNGRNILRLTLEYDAEKRINIKRLVKNSYFDELRHPPETIKMIKPQRFPNGCKRTIGDDGSFPVLYPHLRTKTIRREHYPDELGRSNEGSVSSGSTNPNSISSINGSKCRCSGRSSNKSKSSIKTSTGYQSSATSNPRGIYNMTSLPLVEYKIQKIEEKKIPQQVNIKHKSLESHINKSAVKKSLKSKSTLEAGSKVAALKNEFGSKSLVLPKKTELYKRNLCDVKIVKVRRKVK